MQWLNLQEDTKKQITEIYKSISYTSLQAKRTIESYEPKYTGLGDRILNSYYKGNDNLLNGLCNIAMGMELIDTTGKVCTEIHRPKDRTRRANSNRGRPQSSTGRLGTGSGEKSKKK